MSLELKNIRPTILGGVSYKESPIFIDTPGHLKEFIENQFSKISADIKEKNTFKVDFRKEDIVAELRVDGKEELLILMNEKVLNFQQCNTGDFCFFENEVPHLIYSILEHIERKKVNVFGMMFETDEVITVPEAGILDVTKDDFFPYLSDTAMIIETGGELDRLGFNIKFGQKDWIRHLSVRIENKRALLRFDTRFDKQKTKKELTLESSEQIASFFKDKALNFFIKYIMNDFAESLYQKIAALNEG